MKLFSEDMSSQKRWRYLYHHTPPDYKKLDKQGVYQLGYLKKHISKLKGGKFLEIGCGMGACALVVSKIKGWQAYGIDYTKDNLAGANKYWQTKKARGKLSWADINNMPYPNNTFDLLYGSGVLEHLYDTQKGIDETYRVLKKGGVSVNTVPAFSLASLTYRQLSGTIPDLPVLKELFEFIHIKLLRRKLMHTGYEKCFTAKKLLKYYRQAGFSHIKVFHDARFTPEFKNFPTPLKNILLKLEKYKPFWAWYVVEAVK